MSTKILVTGATGNVSGALLKALAGSGHSVRAVVRDEAKGAALKAQGVELATGDLEKPKSLAGAFAGCDTVWILTPPGPRAPEQSSNALWAARQAGAKHVVRMSAAGAAHDAPTINSRMHALSDSELRLSGIPFTILKPHFFMQNMLSAAGSIAAQGAMYFAIGDAAMPMIDARDIGDAAAKVLTTPGHEGKTYTLTGPAAVTMSELASAIGTAVGKPVKYVPVPVEAALGGMAQSGMNDWMLEAMENYMRAYASGWISNTTPDFTTVTGRPARSVNDFARDFAGAFGKA